MTYDYELQWQPKGGCFIATSPYWGWLTPPTIADVRSHLTDQKGGTYRMFNATRGVIEWVWRPQGPAQSQAEQLTVAHVSTGSEPICTCNRLDFLHNSGCAYKEHQDAHRAGWTK